MLAQSADGQLGWISVEAAPRFHVFQRAKCLLRIGDQVRITRRGKTLEGRELRPGNLYRVSGINPDGYMRLGEYGQISNDFGHLEPFTACTLGTLPNRVDCAIIAHDVLPALNPETLSRLSRFELVFAGCDEDELQCCLEKMAPLAQESGITKKADVPPLTKSAPPAELEFSFD